MYRIPLAAFSIVLGLFIFQAGFLLKRKELHLKSTCSDAKIDSHCWMPKQYKKVVLLVVDALRYDFLVPLVNKDEASAYRGQMPWIQNLILKGDADIGPLIADPPTTTLQRIKAMTTGTLPTFIDAGDNFSPSATINEDSVLYQAHTEGVNVTFFGDDTWLSLFPDDFYRSEAFPSFDINDLESVDDQVEVLLRKLLRDPSDHSNLVIAHLLGVDHCGHKYGPLHAMMSNMLKKMDRIIYDTMQALEEGELLVVIGDHGMTLTGDHGGDSDDEVTAGILVYSPNKKIRLRHASASLSVAPMQQIDIVPTLALLLGVPIPYSNLGTVIEELFDSDDKRAQAVALNYEQISRFANTYATTFGFPQLLDVTGGGDANEKSEQLKIMARLQTMLRTAWTQFNLPLIQMGMLSVLEAVFFLLSGKAVDGPIFIVRSGCILLQLSLFIASGAGDSNDDPGAVPLLLLVLPFSILYSSLSIISNLVLYRPSRSTVASSACILLHCIGFFSNSFVVHEARVLRYLVQSLFLVSLLSCLKRENSAAPRGSRHSSQKLFRHFVTSRVFVFHVVALAIVRLEPLFHRCREEEAADCVSGYAVEMIAALSPDAQLWRLIVAIASILSLNALIGRLLNVYYRGSGERQSLSTIVRALSWPAHALIILYRLVQFVPETWPMKAKCDMLALGIAQVLYACSILCCIISRRQTSKSFAPAYISVIHTISWPLLLLVGDGIQPALVLFLGLLYLVVTVVEPEVQTALFSLLIPFGFYFTGHSPTLTAIPWQAAFTGLPGNFAIRAFPAALVLAHLFLSSILVALSLPLTALPSLRAITVPSAKAPHTGSTPLIVTSALLLASVGLRVLCTCAAATVLRRHLMVWKIFAPRFIFEAVAVIVYVICTCPVVVGVRHLLKVERKFD